MRWEGPRGTDPGKDEAGCRTSAHEEAIRQLPYGNGPPIWGVYRDTSMLQWQQEIDNARYYLERDLVRDCMSRRGYRSVRTAG